MTDDYLGYYQLENYLFETVRERFHRERRLSAFDLFSIIIWKANRSKSVLAKRLIKKAGSIEAAAEQFTTQLAKAATPNARFDVAVRDWGFYLPMASSILSVLWPEEFTVYDIRVCHELGGFGDVGSRTKVQAIWQGYCEYRAAVSAAGPSELSLRDKDRFLWGRSAAKQLVADLQTTFTKRDMDVNSRTQSHS